MKIKANNNPKKDLPKSIILLLVALILIFGMGVFYFIPKGSPSDQIVFTVNNEPVIVREFSYFLDRGKSEVVTYFKEKHNATEAYKDFWVTSFDGETPINVLKESAIAECKIAKIKQILGKQKGLLPDISYAAFIDRLQSENKARKQAIENNEVVYGPVSFDEYSYYSYVLGLLDEKLKKKMYDDREIMPSDEEIRTYYETHKETMYRKSDYVKVKLITIPFQNPDGSINETHKSEIKSVAVRINANLEHGNSMEDLYLKDNLGKSSERVFDETSARGDYMVQDALLRDTSMKLGVGKTSGVLEHKGAFVVIKVLERKNSGYYSFAEKKEEIMHSMEFHKFDELILKLSQEAGLKINQNVYNNLGKGNSSFS